MSFLKDSKAQGALEYLLIIGGAILIAAVVIGIIVSTGSTAADDANAAQEALDATKDSADYSNLLDKAGVTE